MALTTFQRDVCRLLADNRIRSAEALAADSLLYHEGAIKGAFPLIVR